MRTQVDGGCSSLCFSGVEEPTFKTDWKSSPAKGLLRQGFLGSRTTSPSPSSTLAIEEDFSTSQVMGSPIEKSLANVSMAALLGLFCGSSLGAAELGMRFHYSHPGMTESGPPIYSSVSKSQLGYSWRVNKNIGKQLNKNKKMLAEVVADPPVVGLEGGCRDISRGWLTRWNALPLWD